MKAVMTMYEKARMMVRTKHRVHQGSVLSPLLFVEL